MNRIGRGPLLVDDKYSRIFISKSGHYLNTGNLNGDLYAPAEAEETIQTSGDWFWHPGENSRTP